MHWRNFRRSAPLGGACLLGAALLLSAVPGYAAAASSPHGGSKEHAHGYLGIKFEDTSEEQIAAMHLQGPRGAEITMVDQDGPAGQAGLQPRDIVVQMDGRNIDTAEDLSRRIRESAPGRVITLSVVRLGRMLNMTAKLADPKEMERNAWQPHPPDPPPAADSVGDIPGGERFNSSSPGPAPKKPSYTQSILGTVLRTGPYTGVSLETMEPQLAGFFGVPPKTGLLVHAVDANSPAAIAGMRAGDVVVRVDSFLIASTSAWTKRLRASNGHAVTVTIMRDKHEQNLTLQPNAKRHAAADIPVFGRQQEALICSSEKMPAGFFSAQTGGLQ